MRQAILIVHGFRSITPMGTDQHSRHLPGRIIGQREEHVGHEEADDDRESDGKHRESELNARHDIVLHQRLDSPHTHRSRNQHEDACGGGRSSGKPEMGSNTGRHGGKERACSDGNRGGMAGQPRVHVADDACSKG